MLEYIRRKLSRWLGTDRLLEQENKNMADLDALKLQVQANTSAEASAVTLLNGLSAQLAAIATDPVAVAALAAQLKTSADSLSAAIVANTPAAAPVAPPAV